MSQIVVDGQAESLYDVHPAVAYLQAALANLEKQTGKTVDEWVQMVRASGLSTGKEQQAWLKTVHKLGTNQAMWIVERVEGKRHEFTSAATYLEVAAGYVEALYAGRKAALRPVYEELLRLGKGLGHDVNVCPCQTFVPLYREHVFARIKPTTQTRIDLGLALGKTAVTGRLIDTGGLAKGDRITHRIPITSLAEIDEEVRSWLKLAYDIDAP